MKYLSICSGIEAASVAWHPLGWKPLAFSEIEPFPRAVLQHHYPDVPLHGDFTLLKDQPWIADADVLVGGTPCQAFSVAGLRKSLGDDRGNLSLEFIKLADSIDAAREAQGRDPSIVVWENVPGVLSVKDNAFGCFLAGLAGDVTPYVPPRGKWTNAGVVDGPQRQVAWRTLDAQYFGPAQRRRRVFVVASARKGFDPAAVLLEFEGVRRDTPPRREARQVAPTIPSRSTAGGGLGTDLDLDGGVIRQWPADLAPTLNAHFGEKQGLEDQHAFGGAGLFVPSPIFATSGQTNAAFSEDMALTLMAANEQPYITQPLDAGGFSMSGVGYWREGVGPLRARAQDSHENLAITHALRAEGFDASEDGTGRGTPLVPVLSNDPAHAICANEQRTYTNEGSMFQLRNVVGQPVAMAFDWQMGAKAGSTGAKEEQAGVAVRRLTVVECSRLQGFPDDYLSQVTWRGKSPPPDGPMYKALGNSFAVPVVRWIGKRIAGAVS